MVNVESLKITYFSLIIFRMFIAISFAQSLDALISIKLIEIVQEEKEKTPSESSESSFFFENLIFLNIKSKILCIS